MAEIEIKNPNEIYGRSPLLDVAEDIKKMLMINEINEIMRLEKSGTGAGNGGDRG